MKLAIALSTTLILIAPAMGLAQDASSAGRAAGSMAVGPGSKNIDAQKGQATGPGSTMGRSSSTGPSTGQGAVGKNPPASNPYAPVAPDAPMTMPKIGK